jgi:proprotein convertase subtilisin/kexin type 5
LVNTQCLSCSSPCLTCSTIRTNCTSCDTSSGFPYLYSSSCLANCPFAHFDSGAYTCKKCSIPCDTCTSSSICLTCLPGYSKLGNYCYTNCPSLFYSNGTDCISCNLALCKTCVTTADTCLSCATGLYLLGSSCLGSCPGGMNIYNGQICLSCQSNCLTCLTSNASYCTTCYNDSYVYVGSCVATCPTYFYSDDASGSCKSCKSPCK